ncbi:sulfotransferase [Svornostia abyssi]|uniref:Sulfotransferase n=1 Tax=Svornostia abyssi TaxID=2898438 RepID=A0ABY5PNY9_9ACTN|nr:sulfotransferase [Parviterribacteraceae bacterium J379]
MPNLIVIGAAKCATTSLHAYLDAHPEVSMARPRSAVRGTNDDAPKEMRFFWRADWRENLAWYAAHFDPGSPVRGEATPAYAACPFHWGVPERIAEVAPDARLVYLVRDPIDRLMAHWVQARVDGLRSDLEEILQSRAWMDHQIVCPSRYATQVERYLAHFPAEQMLVVDQQDLKHDRERTLAEVFRFVGVDPAHRSAAFDRERNTRGEKLALTPAGRVAYRRVLDPAGRRLAPTPWSRTAPRVRRALSRPVPTPTLSDDVRSRLEDLFRPEVERLRALTGRAFSRWSL